MEFEVLDILNKNGFESYIVGGYVRDNILNKKTVDVDFTTSATLTDLKKLFDVTSENYGSVKIKYKNKAYEITTFRKEFFYINYRYPKKIKFTKNVKSDLKRRDFTINALLMNKDKKIIDYVGGISDIENRCIRMIGNPKKRLKQDSLRILRAIRFATILNFKLDKKLELYIKKYGYLLKYLSYDRKKQELDKIFSSSNAMYGISLLKNLELDKYLEIDLNNIIYFPDLNYMWAQIGCSKYNFNRKDEKKIKRIKECLTKDILDKMVVYNYGIEMCLNVAKIKSINEDLLLNLFKSLPIKNRSEIDYDLSSINKKIIEDIEFKIVALNLKNNKNEIKKYIKQHYM